MVPNLVYKFQIIWGLSWPWSYSSWIYNYLCNRSLSPLMLWVQLPRGVQHYVIKFVSDLRQVNGFLPGPPVSFNNKSDCHNITELLLKVALNNINQNKPNVGRMHGDIYGYGSNLMSVRPSDGDVKIICTNLTPCNEEDSVLLSSHCPIISSRIHYRWMILSLTVDGSTHMLYTTNNNLEIFSKGPQFPPEYTV